MEVMKNMDEVRVHDKTFRLLISQDDLQKRIREIAIEINEVYSDRSPLFVGILNGVFMFAGDLMKNISIPCEIAFMRIKSYQAMQSTGENQIIFGLEENIKNRHLIFLEDIIDTGNTISQLLPQIEKENPASIEIASLLLKPEALQHPLDPKFVGFEIENDFVIGYGLDYDGYGRNFPGIYRLSKSDE